MREFSTGDLLWLIFAFHSFLSVIGVGGSKLFTIWFFPLSNAEN